MLEYYKKYGKITLLKGTILYHWSSKNNLDELNNNSFFCLNNSHWQDNNKILYTYKLKKNLDLILTIQNDDIIKNNEFIIKNYQSDKEVLTTIYLDLFNKNKNNNINNNKIDDVKLKTNKEEFTLLCNKLNNIGYTGLFNYIDSDKGQFEIVIFNTYEYLTKILISDNTILMKYHNLKYIKQKMLSNKIQYYYPQQYICSNLCYHKHNIYPSIFYYIYKKQLNNNIT